MARLVTAGFETQRIATTAVTTAEGEANFVAASATVETTVKRTGLACHKIVNAQGYDRWDITGVLDRTYFARAYFRMSAAPSAQCYLIDFFATARACTLRLNTNGKVGLYNSAGTLIGSESAVLSADTWYRLEVSCNIPTAGNGTVEARIDGTAFVGPTTASVTNAALANMRIGQGNGVTPTFTLYWDDVAVNDDQGASQNSWPGPGAVYLLLPAADNAAGTWTKPGGATTGLSTSVDNTPPVGIADSTLSADAEKQLRNPNNSTSAYDTDVQSYDEAGVPAGETVKVVQALARLGKSTTGAAAATGQLVSNPAEPGTFTTDFRGSGANAGTDPAGWRTYRGAAIYDPSVTRATRPVVRVSNAATTGTKLVDLMGVYVESAPGGAKAPPFVTAHRRRAHLINR